MKYIHLFRNNWIAIVFTCLVITFFVIQGGLMLGHLDGDGGDDVYEYTVGHAGSSVEVDGSLYQYSDLSEAQQDVFDESINGDYNEKNVNETNFVSMEDHTIQKNKTMYAMEINHYNQSAVMYELISATLLLFIFSIITYRVW